MSDEAVRARKKMLVDTYYTTELCDCEWPLTTYRNRHGHSPDCPWVTEEHRRDTDPGDLAMNLRKRAAAFGVPQTSMISTTGSLLFEAAETIDNLRGILQEVLDCLGDDEVLISPAQYPCMARALGIGDSDDAR